MAFPPMTKDQAGQAAVALLGAIMQMSDHAESLGGARSLARRAARHTQQNTQQNNGPRMAAFAQAFKEATDV